MHANDWLVDSVLIYELSRREYHLNLLVSRVFLTNHATNPILPYTCFFSDSYFRSQTSSLALKHLIENSVELRTKITFFHALEWRIILSILLRIQRTYTPK